MYINVKSNIYPFNIADLPRVYPNTSFPSDYYKYNNLLESYGIYVVNPVELPTINTNTEVLVETYPTSVNGMWFQVWDIQKLPKEEADALQKLQAIQCRKDRDLLLQSSDWSQVADAPVNKEIWATYRQQLRDVTKQPNFPYEVVWPNKPE